VNITLPEIAAGGRSQGEMGLDAVEALQKALTAGYGTDPATFTGGSALRVQSLDKTMYATIQENKHFRLFNALASSNSTATVDEWTEQNGVGGFLGGSSNTETGVIASADGSYARRTALVKYLMTKREVSLVATLGNNIASAEAIEQSNGAAQLLSDAEFLCFEGDSAVVPTEFDGVYAQIAAGIAAGQVDDANIIDAGATPLNSIHMINKAAAQVSSFGNFGVLTHVFTSNLVQSDFDTGLDPAFRVALDNSPNSLMLGAPVAGIKTSWGVIKTMPDVFVREDLRNMPFQLLYPTVAAAQDGLKPAGVALAVAADAASQFTAPRAGNYYYLVTGVNAAGQSTGFVSAVQAVAAGQKCTLTITKSVAGAETGYIVYRSRQNGTNAVNDFRECARVARTGASTVWVDQNRMIPGTTKAYLLNMAQGGTAISWRQFLPMMRFALYPTNSATIPWAQLLFGYLRLTKRRHHVVIKNILPTGSTWLPFA